MKNGVCVLVAQLYPTLCDPINCSLPGFCPWNSPDKNTGVGCHSILQGNLPNPGIEPGCPTLQAYYLPFEPQGKPDGKDFSTSIDSLIRRVCTLVKNVDNIKTTDQKMKIPLYS